MAGQDTYTSQFAESGTPDAGGARSRVNWPTVLAAAGVAAVVSSIISVIAVVGIVVSERSSDSATAQPTVISLGTIGEPGEPQAAASVGSEPAAPAAESVAPTTQAPAAAAAPPAGAGPAAATATVPPGTAPLSTTPVQAGRGGGPLPGNFTVTAENPTLEDLGNIVELLVETNASDAAKAENLEAGMAGVVVPRTVYSLGLFRAPNGWNEVTGPLVQNGSSVTATLNSGSVGRPTIKMTIEFKQVDGVWKLASSSLCLGVQTVGLNIYCNA